MKKEFSKERISGFQLESDDVAPVHDLCHMQSSSGTSSYMALRRSDGVNGHYDRP